MKHKHRSTEFQPSTSARFLIAGESERSPGKHHEAKHGLDIGPGQILHISTSITGFGRLRWLRWDAEKIHYEIEGKPEGLSFDLKLVTLEVE